MSGIFQAIEIGKRALLSSQITLQTIGHNIANVNTPGFTRQRVLMWATKPMETTIGSIGTGVDIASIKHVRDPFLDRQFRQENKSLGMWSYKAKISYQVEAMFGEPNDETISDHLNEFWDSWASLAQNANSATSRQQVVNSTELLTNAFHNVADQLQSLRNSINHDLSNYTGEINQITAEIGILNQQIRSQELGGAFANDARDRRDYLVDQLSSLVDVNTIEGANGQFTVSIGAIALVNGNEVVQIHSEEVVENGQRTNHLKLGNTSLSISSFTGEIRGLLDMRDEIIPARQAELDLMAETLVTEVNALHRSGYSQDGSTGINFFDPDNVTASGIRLSLEIANNPDRIVTAQVIDAEGDNRIALAIHDLQESRVMSNNTSTINDYYNAMIGSLGIETRQAQSFAENYEAIVNQITSARESVEGVSLDEEMTNMIKYQHAYDAAARVITVMDEAMDTLIYRVGTTGR